MEEIIEQDLATKTAPKSVLIFLAFFFFASFLGYVLVGKNTKNSDNAKTMPQSESAGKNKFIDKKTLVYGSWSGTKSLIMSYDLATGSNSLLFDLPSTIKKVSFLSDRKIIFINSTDQNDHGAEIASISLDTKKIKTLFKTDSKFGIDDYVLSPDKRFLAVWEVSFAPGLNLLAGGMSRVYTLDLRNPNKKNLLYDETASLIIPLHYPRAITNEGKVFLDKFVPNSGAGWAYGMSMSDFTGTQKEDLSSMPNGTYSSQPYLGPDSKYLVFTGYNGDKGPGTDRINGFRRSILNPNTLEILDTISKERKVLLSSKDTLYTTAKWADENNILVSAVSKTPGMSGFYVYNLRAKSFKKISSDFAVLAALSDGAWLLGNPHKSDSMLGNLGDTYDFSFVDFRVLQKDSSLPNPLMIQNGVMQFITLLPDSIQGTNIAFSQTAEGVSSGGNRDFTRQNLQLATFKIKPSLAPQRSIQQSNPTDGSPSCQELAKQYLQELDPLSKEMIRGGNNDIGQQWNKLAEKLAQLPCFDSPLYLYGQAGKIVNLKIGTKIFNSIPASSGSYRVTLETNGILNISGRKYESIKYDYIPSGSDFKRPKKGTVVARKDLVKTIKYYAEQLGLNKRETNDLQNFAQKKLSSKYIFVSFLDQVQSERLLPISFNPRPDSYLNIVFYFRQLQKPLAVMPEKPHFVKFQRFGFAAVEISEVVE